MTSSFKTRYRKWWLGDDRTDVHLFLAEEFAETQKGVHLVMFMGAVLFFIRGIVDLWSVSAPLGKMA